MCGFMVVTGSEIEEKVFVSNFNKIQYRGPDDSSVTVLQHGIFGFHRLSIMGIESSGMQPFYLDNSLVVCNGEIYEFMGFKNELIEKGYSFKSGSDCEVLLPLYKEYGFDMFNKLDGEFACVMYVDNTFIAARDPLGIRPMFYGYTQGGNIAFASEVKCLVELCIEVYPFPPGHYYNGKEFISYLDVSVDYTKHHDDLEDIFKNVNKLLTDGIVKRLDSDVPLGFLLSGGLDSSLVCSIATKHLNKPIKTFAVGMECDAIDLKYAKEVADYIGSVHSEVIMTKEEIIESIDEVIYHLETYDITTIRASIGMYLLCKWIRKNTDIKVILTGEVSDELFGYKYTDFAPSAIAFQEESQKRMKELYMYDVLRADRCISGCSLEGRVPFGDLKFMDYVLGIHPSKKMNVYNKGKYLLRQAFAGDYLPESILNREKAAFSDAVGHSMVDYIKEHVEEYYSDEVFNDKIKAYSNNAPFTKESLYYREVFEKHYPSCSHLIVDYWMPNKEWDGCNVDDPSARVLANYGQSGE